METSAHPYYHSQFLFDRRYRSPEDMERILEHLNIAPEDFEDFWGSLQNFGKQAMQIAPQVLPGVVQGASTGSAFGPYGALAGGIIGGLSGALGGKQSASGTSPMPVQPTGGSQPVSPGSLPQASPQVGGSPAAGQLLQLITRPEVLQALMSMVLGRYGAQQVQVGSSQTGVPPAAFANMVGVLANQAASEQHMLAGPQKKGLPAYLLNYAGEAEVDHLSPETRAYILMELLQEGSDEEYDPRYSEDPNDRLDEFYDGIDLATLNQ